MGLIAEKIGVLFILILMGYVLTKRAVLTNKSKDALVTLIFSLSLPCMMLSTITDNELTDDTLSITLLALGIAAAVLVVLSFIGYYIAHLFKVPASEYGTYILLFGTSNIGFVGFPLVKSLFSAEIFYLMVIINIAYAVYTNGLGDVIINIGESSHEVNKKALLIRTIKNPVMLASFAGFIMLFAGWKLPAVIFEPVSMLGSTTAPLALIILGIQLGESKLKNFVKKGKNVAFMLIKLLVGPACTFLMVNWLPIPVNVKVILVVSTIFPNALVIPPMAYLNGKDSVNAAEIVVLSVLFSLFTMPILLTLVKSYYGV